MSELQAISISKYLGYTLIHCDGNNQLEYAKYQKTRQCEICNCLLDKSLISQNCQSGSIGQSSPGLSFVDVCFFVVCHSLLFVVGHCLLFVVVCR